MLTKSLLQWPAFLVMILIGQYSPFVYAKTTVEAEVVVTTELESTINVSTATLLQALMLDKGTGSFVQKKYFKFLAVPIRSTGTFIVEQQAVLWQTQQPVFSEVLIKASAIYQRLAPADEYEQLVDNAEFSSLLATIFSGKINPEQWQVGESVKLSDTHYCLDLQPKAQQLQQLFQQVDLCLPPPPAEISASKNQPHFDLDKRHINIFDMQGNKTQISMLIKQRTLNAEQEKSLALPQEQMNKKVSIEAINKQAQVNAQ